MAFTPDLAEVLIYSAEDKSWLYFRRPEAIIAIYDLPGILPALEEIDGLVNQRGKYAAGFIAFDAAPAFDRALRARAQAQPGFPLLWFGIYANLQRLPAQALATSAATLPGPWRADVSQRAYQRAIKTIKDHIACGDTYQVNYTYRLGAPCPAQAWPVFAMLAEAHAARYAAFLETQGWAVCSISPELFFSRDGERLVSRPMKGTAPRGLTLEDDQRQAEWLGRSEKNRAENVMIVDMVRNDLGRIAHIGSVRVPALFQVEKYPTIWQMTSTVTAESSAGLVEVLRALFPPASITGAPKVRTMQIIAQLEASPRRIYTGALGFLAPGRVARFNVAIRTLLIDKQRQVAEYGVGGGIVWDSTAAGEWRETHAKARILFEHPGPFELLETLRWTPEQGWFLLEKHLARLERSAAYFDYPLDLAGLQRALNELPAGFQDVAQRVRLRLGGQGRINFEHQPLAESPPVLQVAIAREPVQSQNRFLYHKTTRRELYQEALAGAPRCDEVLLWNERGELTEATIANLVVELGGELFTPPLSCGLLPGTYRAWLLETGIIRERVIRREELQAASRIFLINSLRGMWEVQIV